MLRIIFALSLCFLLFTANSQEQRQYAFTRYSTATGLLTNSINSIAQCNDGYIWFAGSNGLQRFDGNNFLTFKSQAGDKTSLPSDNLVRLHVDKKGRLWVIGLNNWMGIFDTRTFKFSEVKLVTKTPKNIFTGVSFFETSAGKLYYSESNGGTFSFDENKKQFLPADADIPQPPGWKRIAVSFDEELNSFWMTSDSGISVYNATTRNLNYINHNPDNVKLINSLGKEKMMLGVTCPKGEGIYFVSWPVGSGVPNLITANKKTGSFIKHLLNQEIGLGYHEIGGVLQQKNGRVWTFGKSFLAEIVNNGRSFIVVPNEYKNEQSIRFDNVMSILEDRTGNIWFGTDNGVFHFNPDAQHFHVYNLKRPASKTSLEAPVQSVLEMNDGNYLVGCWGAGLYMFDKNFKPVDLPKALQNKVDVLSIWDMHKHSRTGKIWIVLQAGGIIIYDPIKRTSEELMPGIFEKRTIRKLVEDKDGNLWFGHQGGRIVKWDLKQSGGDPSKGYNLIKTSGATYEIFVDRDGYIWVGTMALGLHKIDSKSGAVIKTFTEEGIEGERLFSNLASDIVQYDDTTIIVTAGCLNIINTRTNKVSFFSTAQGLPSNTAQCIEIDGNGILWVGMENGLCRVNFKKKVVNTYDRRDGITFDNFGAASSEKLSGGRLVFMTDHNFVVFDPKKLMPSTAAAKPIITSFKLGGRDLQVDSLLHRDRIELNYDNTSIEVQFSGLTYLKQNTLHFFYKLESIDKDWHPADAWNRAVYNYLPPGNYVFMIKGVNSNGQETGIKEFKIHVSPPFWKTWWFLGLCMLAILWVLFRIDKERMSRLREVQQTRAAIAGSLHQDIHTTLNNINILSEMSKMKIEKDINRTKEYIQQISEKSHNMIIAMDDMLWSIDPQNDAMDGTLLRTREFIDSLQSRHEARISLAVDDKVRVLELDMKVRHEFFLILKMILRLIAEDAHGKEMQLNVDYFKSKLALKVRGENVAINTAHPTISKKLEEIKKRAGSINAVLDVQNDPSGISVILIVKL